MLPRGRLVGVGAVGTLCVLIFAAVEAAGRRVQWLMPVQWQIEQFALQYPFSVLPDDELGFSMPPNQHEVIRTRDYAFLAETDFNGYPNRDPWPADPTLVFLGDSFLIGAGVGLDNSFTGLLARMLPTESIVNLGLAGAGPERQARIYRRFGGGWRPSIVVSCLFLASDIENDVHFLSWLREGRRTEYNKFRLDLAREARYRGVVQRVLDKSWLLNFGQQVARRVTGDEHVEPRYRFADGTEILFERHAQEFATAQAAADDARIAPFLASVRQLQQIVVETSGAPLLLMLIPSKEELFGTANSATRVNLAARIKDRLILLNMPVLDLYPPIQRGGAVRTPYFSHDIHLNAFGNRIVADAFARWFERNQRRPD
jgi:hypothetical protein